MASSMNEKFGSSQGSSINETFFSCRVCNQVFEGAHALLVHFNLAHMKKNGCDRGLKLSPSEPTKVSPLAPPPLASFPSQTSSWKMQESVEKINRLSEQQVANDRHPRSGSGGKVPSFLQYNKNHYVTGPYPLSTSHARQIQKLKPNIGTSSGSLLPSQSLALVPMIGHASQPLIPTPSRSQEVNPILETGSIDDDGDYLCAKCKLAKQLRQQGIQVQKSNKEDGHGKIDLSLKL